VANPVGWFEIHAKDGKKAQDFYASLFGWNVDTNNPMSYGMVQSTGDGGIGGGITGPNGPMVTIYVNVDDLAATLKKAEGLGGSTVMPPMDVPGGPSIAQFKDPEGNIIGIMKGM
jgi:uncharacterized protein